MRIGSFAGKVLVAALLAALALALLALAPGRPALPGAPATAQADAARCPDTFRVLHDDRVGRLKLPKGHYRIRLIDDATLTCQRASRLFARFLQDFDGVLPNGWKVLPATATFQKRADKGFSVKKVRRRSGSGGGRHPSGRFTTCPTFEVLHNDQIDGHRFPRGTYQMTALGRLTCLRASRRFAAFLEAGETPRPWRLREGTGTFRRGDSRRGFQVNLWRR